MSRLRVPFSKTRLRNGLDVIVHEHHDVPIVAVSVWYHVGSKNERPGRTGFAHLFEHLMFEGSAHHPSGYFEPLQEAGAAVNGSTSVDRTNYWELVPTPALERALWMEADRMGWLLPALTEARFETQRSVVLNERRQNYENRPYGRASFALHRALYPSDHPYSWPTIGEPADLLAATLDDVRDFFARYYHPANASVAIAGDVDAAEAFALVETLFADIPPGPAVERVRVAPVAARAQSVVLEDQVPLPRLYLAWPTPALFEPGDAELDLVSDLLASGRTSRLYRRLVHDRRIATELAAAQASREAGGLFQILATAAPGRSLAELDVAIREEVARLADDGPTDAEVDRGRAQAEASFVYRLESLGGFGGKADQLNAYNTYRGNPDFFAADLQRYLEATADGLRDAAGRWVDPAAVTALSIVPAGRLDLALADAAPVVVS
jgi:zinc protease